MRRFAWIITLPVTLVVVIFAIANRGGVTLDLWPLEMSYSLPLFALVLIAILVGFVCGAAVMWFSAGKARNKAREFYYRASNLERELTYLKRKQGKAAEPAAVARTPAVPARR